MAVLTVMHLLMRAVSAIIHTDVEIEVNDIGGSYMIKEIVKDTFLLSRRSEAATLQEMCIRDRLQVVQGCIRYGKIFGWNSRLLFYADLFTHCVSGECIRT